jgi:succinate dehydrogenase/fumarate reductase flavoprotein subunit
VTIKSIPFGGIVLNGKDAERFIRHMQDDAPSPRLAAALVEGRAILQKMRATQK